MRRLLLAAALVLAPAFLLTGCGGANPALDAPLIKEEMRELARAVVNNDRDKIKGCITGIAGITGNPLFAQDWDKPEGKEKIQEANRRDMLKIFKDSGILGEGDIERFLGAIRITLENSKNGTVKFDIAGGNGRRPELVTFRVTKLPNPVGWKIYDYYREMK